jgi:hypothetical protein
MLHFVSSPRAEGASPVLPPQLHSQSCSYTPLLTVDMPLLTVDMPLLTVDMPLLTVDMRDTAVPYFKAGPI